MSARRGGGFSLIELMVTMAILALLASVAVPFAQLVQQRHKETELREALRQIRGALDAYKLSVKEGRIQKVEGGSGYPPDLDSLWKGVTDQTQPDSTKSFIFWRRLPRDPFLPGRCSAPCRYLGIRSYASPADAPVAGADIFDVYSLSSASGLNGVPYQEW